MKPVIGISGNFGTKGCELAEGYYQSILQAGGIPVIIPPYEDQDSIIQCIERLDGILLSGGGDMNPLIIGEEPLPGLHSICPQRDNAELMLIRNAVDRQVPILGICRGIQMLAVALGGSVYQDLDSQYHDAPLIKHSQDLAREYASHTALIQQDSILSQIFQQESIPVNSFHHQAVRDSGPQLHVTARSVDGVIEAVESSTHKSIMGVQWHPECFILRGDRSMMPIFQWLVGQASSFQQAKSIHSRILTLDSHCDTPMKFNTDQERLTTLERMHNGHQDATIMVAYIAQKERTPEAHLAATAKADRILTQIEEMVAANCTQVDIAYTPDDLYRLKADGKKAIMLGIENGYAIGHDISQIQHFRDRGIVYMTLCHNGDNDICDSARNTNNEHGGVSDFGKDVIREMNRVGMMVDLSHAGEKSFYDAIDISAVPIVCSHSSSRALCDHPRNLTDDQMKALAHSGGVAQVTFYEGFLRTDSQASILDAVNHLNHMVNVMGIQHVGIGTDFDGDGGVPGIAHSGELINFTRRLLLERYSMEDLRLLWGENFLRIMRQAQSYHQS